MFEEFRRADKRKLVLDTLALVAFLAAIFAVVYVAAGAIVEEQILREANR